MDYQFTLFGRNDWEVVIAEQEDGFEVYQTLSGYAIMVGITDGAVYDRAWKNPGYENLRYVDLDPPRYILSLDQIFALYQIDVPTPITKEQLLSNMFTYILNLLAKVCPALAAFINSNAAGEPDDADADGSFSVEPELGVETPSELTLEEIEAINEESLEDAVDVEGCEGVCEYCGTPSDAFSEVDFEETEADIVLDVTYPVEEPTDPEVKREYDSEPGDVG